VEAVMAIDNVEEYQGGAVFGHEIWERLKKKPKGE
jgi:hypothetical protein